MEVSQIGLFLLFLASVTLARYTSQRVHKVGGGLIFDIRPDSPVTTPDPGIGPKRAGGSNEKKPTPPNVAPPDHDDDHKDSDSSTESKDEDHNKMYVQVDPRPVWTKKLVYNETTYNKMECPPSGCPHVTVHVSVLKILDISEKQKAFTIKGKFTFVWKDERLKPNATGNHLTVEQAEGIWLPHIFVKGLKEKKDFNRQPLDRSDFGDFNTLIKVDKNKTVNLTRIIVVRIGFELELKAYPYDEQELHVHFGKLAFEDREVNFTVKVEQEHLNKTDLPPAFEYEVCKPHENEGLNITVRRVAHHHKVQMYIPCYFIVVLSWIPLYIPYRRATRIKLSFTAVLTMMTFAAGLKSTLPATKDLRNIDVFLLLCLGNVWLSMVGTLIASFGGFYNDCLFCCCCDCYSSDKKKTFYQRVYWRMIPECRQIAEDTRFHRKRMERSKKRKRKEKKREKRQIQKEILHEENSENRNNPKETYETYETKRERRREIRLAIKHYGMLHPYEEEKLDKEKRDKRKRDKKKRYRRKRDKEKRDMRKHDKEKRDTRTRAKERREEDTVPLVLLDSPDRTDQDSPNKTDDYSPSAFSDDLPNKSDDKTPCKTDYDWPTTTDESSDSSDDDLPFLYNSLSSTSEEEDDSSEGEDNMIRGDCVECIWRNKCVDKAIKGLMFFFSIIPFLFIVMAIVYHARGLQRRAFHRPYF